MKDQYTATSTSDRSLWAAVIMQALEDATSPMLESSFKDGNAYARRAAERHQARAWFNVRAADFIEVCYLAGLDPEAVIARALSIFRRCDKAEAMGERFTMLAPKSEAHAPTAVTKVYEAHGKRMTLTEWAEVLGVPKATLASRISAGRHPLEIILSPDFKRLPRSNFNGGSPGRKATLHTINGVTRTIEGWAEVTGIPKSTLRVRLRKGFSMEDAIAFGQCRRGVGYDFAPSRGTGVGSNAQETANIEISAESLSTP